MNSDHEQMVKDIFRDDPQGYNLMRAEARKLFDFLFDPEEPKPASPKSHEQLCEIIALYMAHFDVFQKDLQFMRHFLVLLRILCRNLK